MLNKAIIIIIIVQNCFHIYYHNGSQQALYETEVIIWSMSYDEYNEAQLSDLLKT